MFVRILVPCLWENVIWNNLTPNCKKKYQYYVIFIGKSTQLIIIKSKDFPKTDIVFLHIEALSRSKKGLWIFWCLVYSTFPENPNRKCHIKTSKVVWKWFIESPLTYSCIRKQQLIFANYVQYKCSCSKKLKWEVFFHRLQLFFFAPVKREK